VVYNGNLGAMNAVVKNSIINGNGGRGYGVYFSTASSGSVGVSNNNIVFNYTTGSSSVGYRAESSVWNVSILNCVAADITARGYYVSSTTVIKNSISANVDNDWVGDPFQEINYTISADDPIGGVNDIITTDWDSIFVNKSIGDFRLKPGSVAVDAGVALDSFGEDVVGVTRPVGSAWDIGAFEWNGNKGVIPEDVGSPFFVNSSVENNPVGIGVIAEGTSQVVSWEVHANAEELGSTYSFFSFFESLFETVFSGVVNVTVLVGEPWIWFVDPTPEDGNITNDNFIYVNYSVNDTNLGGAYSVIDMDGSLVGWYRMDQNVSMGENATHVLDWSGSGNNGTLVGATWSSGGKFGGVYEFDTEGDAVNVDSVSSISTRAYWSENGTDWNHIVVTGEGSYVNGVLKCSSDMAYIDKLGGYCIDRYEASMPSANSTDMGNSTEVADPDDATGKAAQSVVGVVPWVSVSQVSARVACSNAGKHLCTSEEWLGAANLQGQVYDLPATLSVAPYGCVVDSGTYCTDNSYDDGEACNTGYNTSGPSGCYSAEGVFDMVGNVWELVNESVDIINPDGVAGEKYLNSSGEWQNSTSGLWGKYGQDRVYFPEDSNNRAGKRGGFWDGATGPGLFNVNYYFDSTGTLNRAGFRCCKD